MSNNKFINVHSYNGQTHIVNKDLIVLVKVNSDKKSVIVFKETDETNKAIEIIDIVRSFESYQELLGTNR